VHIPVVHIRLCMKMGVLGGRGEGKFREFRNLENLGIERI
jgi:hypothetical protein